ncbi:MAG: hypothetical protein AABZ74_11115 [Cyanobacteriota bacterium]
MRLDQCAKNVFISSLETIYKSEKTNNLIKIFNQKLEYYRLMPNYFGESLIRYKYLEVLKVIRKELLLRDIHVDIFH